MSERPKVTLNVYLFIQNGNDILLSLRENTGYEDDKWSFVAGHCEAEETASASMCREAKEEANLQIEEGDLALIHIMHRKTDRYNIDLFMKPNQYNGEVKNMEPHKCAGLKFFNINELPGNIIPYIREAITHIQNKQIYSEFGF